MASCVVHVGSLLSVLVCVHLAVGGKYDEKYGRHNITMGHRRLYPYYPVDIRLFHDSPKVASSFMRVVSHDVCYPPKGSHPARFTITAFNVTDLVPSGEGGYAFVTDGGVGYDKLCLHLKTQRGGSYLFDVVVFGYYM